LQEADVLFVNIDVDETADGAGFIDEALFDPGVTGLEFDDRAGDVIGVDLDEFFVVGQFAERCGDSYFGHIKL
jgi:hypothetical protein